MEANAEQIAIPPPPQCVYPKHDEAEAALHAWTLKHGFNVSRRRARYVLIQDVKVVWARNFECDRAGSLKNTQKIADGDRVRAKRGSKRMGCPMRISIRAVDKNKPDGEWGIYHTERSEHHNHPASEDPSVHAAHRQRSAKTASGLAETQRVDSLVVSQVAVGIPPSRIHASLSLSHPHTLLTRKDIANAKQAERTRELGSETAMQALFRQMAELNFFFKNTTNPDSHRLEKLAWAHPLTAKLFKENADIVVMDCTYKTNRFDLPLLNVIAITGMNTVLPVFQAWLPGEAEPDFVWALNMLRLLMIENDVPLARIILTDRDLACMKALCQVFPGIPIMVCRWHMVKNVESRVRQELGQARVENPAPGQPAYQNSLAADKYMTAFYKAVDSDTEASFETNCTELREMNATLAAYLQLHWWKYKTQIVECWTNAYMHFGVRDTSTVEGTHAIIKSRLLSSKGDLYSVFQKLLPWWTEAAHSTLHSRSYNELKTPFLIRGNEYAGVVRIITNYALTETAMLWKTARRNVLERLPRTACTGTFRSVHGRPCVHELMDIIETDGKDSLRKESFDKHWWIRLDPQQQKETRILDPVPRTSSSKAKRTKRSHHRNMGVSGTARDPIFAERIDANHPATPPRVVMLTSVPDQSGATIRTETGVPVPAPQTTHRLPRSNSSFEGVPHVANSPPEFQESDIPARRWGYAGRKPY
jgi:hypothetical protein